MNEHVQNKLTESLQAAEGLYYRLVLLVGEANSGKTKILNALAKAIKAKVININMVLSADLLEFTAKKRVMRLPEILTQIIDRELSPVILDNTEILFDKELNQDPLRLLQKISRNKVVLASWSGAISENKLIYAEPGHPEYRSYNVDELLLVSTTGRATIDSVKNNIGIGNV